MTPTRPCPDRATLWSLVAGEKPADEAPLLWSHVAVCPACAEGVAELRESERRLAEVLPRGGGPEPRLAASACPEPEVMAALLDDGLEAPAREALLAHAALCDACAAELADAAQILSLGASSGLIPAKA